MSLRDLNVIVLETGKTVIRAGLGLHDLLKTPSVEIPARVGYRISEGDLEAERVASTSRSKSTSFPCFPQPNATVQDYLVGTALDEVLASGSRDILVSWPFSSGDIGDWAQAEALWKYTLFNQLGRKRLLNESPVLLTLCPGQSRASYERMCQIFFERFNVAGFGILETPMAQAYAVNTLTGVIVDIGAEETDVNAVVDGAIVHQARLTTAVGTRDCERYLVRLLKSNSSVMSTLSPPDAPLSEEDLETTLLALVQFIRKEGHIKVPSDGEAIVQEDEGVTDIAAIIMAGKEKAVIESGMKKKANAKASAAEQARAREIEAMDLLTVEFQGKSVTLGKERHRFCEPLFDSQLWEKADGSEMPLPLQDAVAHAVAQTDIDSRRDLFAGLVVTGEVTIHVRGMSTALQSRVAPFLLGNSDLPSDVQPRSARALSVPEFYPEYRETGDGYAAFLGASIVAKITFINDSANKTWVTKTDYSNLGPAAIVVSSASLL